MDINRYVKQIRKQSKFLINGLRPSAVLGRFVGPKVFINSVPKAGTNLLQELIILLPLMRGKITKTYSSMSGTDSIINKICAIKNGECAPGHITYDHRVDRAIIDNNVRHILVIRDFRDVLYSNIKYLETVHISHPHNKYISTLSTFDEKIEACLTGHKDVGMIALPYFINQYRNWLISDNILVVRYEDLIAKNTVIAEQEISKIISYLGINIDVDICKVRKKMFNSKGLTFNEPGVEKWRRVFSSQQLKLLNQALGNELTHFGYKV